MIKSYIPHKSIVVFLQCILSLGFFNITFSLAVSMLEYIIMISKEEVYRCHLRKFLLNFSLYEQRFLY